MFYDVYDCVFAKSVKSYIKERITIVKYLKISYNKGEYGRSRLYFDRDIDEKNMEKETYTEIECNNRPVFIPEYLIEERVSLTGMSRESVIESLQRKAVKFQKCLVANQEYSEENFQTQFIRHIDAEMSIYRIGSVTLNC